MARKTQSIDPSKDEGPENAHLVNNGSRKRSTSSRRRDERPKKRSRGIKMAFSLAGSELLTFGSNKSNDRVVGRVKRANSRLLQLCKKIANKCRKAVPNHDNHGLDDVKIMSSIAHFVRSVHPSLWIGLFSPRRWRTLQWETVKSHYWGPDHLPNPDFVAWHSRHFPSYTESEAYHRVPLFIEEYFDNEKLRIEIAKFLLRLYVLLRLHKNENTARKSLKKIKLVASRRTKLSIFKSAVQGANCSKFIRLRRYEKLRCQADKVKEVVFEDYENNAGDDDSDDNKSENEARDSDSDESEENDSEDAQSIEDSSDDDKAGKAVTKRNEARNNESEDSDSEDE